MINFANFVETQFETKIKRWRPNHGGEFENKTINSFFSSKGISHEFSPPYEHERNGIAERFNQTLTTMARARAMIMNQNKNLWAEAISTACYLKNCLPHSRLPNNITPHESLLYEKPSIDHLQPFGKTCYVHIHKDSRKPGSKLLPRAIEGKFVGYTNSTKTFRIYIPSQNKVIESPTVRFAPQDSGEVTINFQIQKKIQRELNNNMIYPHQNDGQTTVETRQITPESDNSEDDSSNQLLTETILHQHETPNDQAGDAEIPGAFLESPKADIRPKRSSKPIKRYGSPISHGPTMRSREEHDHELGRLVKAEDQQQKVESYAIALAAKIASETNEEPKTINEALSGSEKDLWQKAINKELQSLAQNHTWDVVPRPQKRNIVGSKWVFKIKYNADGSIERYKARLVAQGFSRLPGHDFDETFAPVARYDSLRILLRIASQHKWTPQQMDVNSAYLYGTLKEEIYMEMPPGFKTHGKCVILKKCIYGPKQSGREWYACISTALQQKNFKIASFDPCVFIHPVKQVFIAIYVDDILIFGPNNSFSQNLKTSIGNDFECKDLGNAKYLLGLEIIHESSGIRLSQQGYSKKILERFGFNNSHKISTPLDPNITLFKGIEEERINNVKEYQAIVESLMYLVIGSRPGLAYSVTLLSQFSSCPNENHLRAAKRTLRYLSGTVDWDLYYPFCSNKTVRMTFHPYQYDASDI
ncbi:hypothetical protein K3495_g11788 [Podosphaera aphanis]|nr:hypothetical protein K3495_g11788 [Podosphaera aphanis]